MNNAVLNIVITIVLMLIVVVVNTVLFATIPSWQGYLIHENEYFLQPSEPGISFFGKEMVVWFFFMIMVWSIGFLSLWKIHGAATDVSFHRSGRGLIVFVLPVLAGHAVVQGSRLAVGALVLSILLYILWLGRKSDAVSGGPTTLSTRCGPISFLSFFRSRLPLPDLFLMFVCGLIIIVASGRLVPLEQPTGDEPNYLIITHSLVVDRDLNLENNYRNKDYHLFYADHLHHRVSVDEKGRWLPSQGIGLPVLLAPAYWLGMKCGDVTTYCRLMISVLAVLTILCTFLMMRNDPGLTVFSRWALVAMAASSPFLLYSHQLYPEIPAALLFVCALRPRRHAGMVSGIVSGIAAGLLPWLGIKFIIPLAAMMAVWFVHGLVSLRTRKTTGDLTLSRESFLRWIVALLMIVIFFTVFHHIYGTFNFVKTHGIKGTEAADFSSSLSWSLAFGLQHFGEATRIASGYLFDQRVGICMYSPVCYLLLGGIIIGLFSKSLFHWVTLAVVLSHWALFAWTGQWEGYCLPTRYLVPLIPFFALWLGIVFERCRHTWRIHVVQWLTAISCSIGFFMLFHLHRFYHFTLWRNPDEPNRQLAVLSNAVIDWTRVFPSFTAGELSWIPIILCFVTMIMGTVLVLGWTRNTETVTPRHARRSPFPYAVLAAVVLIIAGHAQGLMELRQTTVHCFGRANMSGDGWCMRTPDCFPPEAAGVWVRGGGTARFIPEGVRGTDKDLQLTIHSIVGNRIAILSAGKQFSLDLAPDRKVTVTIAGIGDHDADIVVRCARGVRPSTLSPSLDRRYLGCFLTMKWTGTHQNDGTGPDIEDHYAPSPDMNTEDKLK